MTQFSNKHSVDMTIGRQRTHRGIGLIAGTSLLMSTLALPALATDSDTSNQDSSAATQAMQATEQAWDGAKTAANDAYIKGRLVTAYALSEHLSPFDIDVSVQHSTVTLNGAVSDDVARDLAVEIAEGIDAVNEVASQLRLDETLASDADMSSSDSFAASFSDATISARVKTQLLWNNNVKGLDIDVDTDDRVVTLSGQVDSKSQSALAEEITRNTNGVASVVNELQTS